MSFTPHIIDETAPLKAVVLGIANDLGGTPAYEDCYDPKSKEHVLAGTFPLEKDLIAEIDHVAEVLEKHGVKVHRPKNVAGLNQVFSRDIAFVVDNDLHIANVIAERTQELEGIQHIIDQVDQEHVLRLGGDIRVEGGDVMPWGEHLFVGYSEAADFEKFKVARTNRAGLDHLKARYPNRKTKGFELNKSDSEPRDNALHLDCCFQPVGRHLGIIYPGGFKNPADVDYMEAVFGKENLIEIDRIEMYNMNSNIFSVSPELLISNSSFTRLNAELRSRGIEVEEVPYNETAKMEGLLRCSTMPLIRE